MNDKIVDFLNGPIIVINLGLARFAAELEAQGISVVQVDWLPPAGGDREMMELLDDLL